MDKLVKDVFFNCIDVENKLATANIDEIKFSKKLNAAILKASSSDNIPLYEIEKFEQRAKKMYELNSFRIDYSYCGKAVDVEEQDVKNIIEIVKKRYDYTSDVFLNCKININNELGQIVIILKKEYANFLIIKRIDEYIKRCIEVQFGKKYRIIIKDDEDCISQFDDNGVRMIKLEELISISNNNGEISNNSSNTPKTQNSYSNVGGKKEFKKRPPLTPEEKEERKLAKQPQPENVIYGINITTDQRIRMIDINVTMNRVCFDGQIIKKEVRETKSGKMLVMLDVTDFSSTLCCKMFLTKEQFEKVDSRTKTGTFVVVQGRPALDQYSNNELGIMISSLNDGVKFEIDTRMDEADEKRVELHLHTQMSAMDAVSSAKDIISKAVKWGMPAIAITDHGVAQSYPEAHHYMMDKFGKKGATTQEVLDSAPIKVIYGVEGYLVKDIEPDYEKLDTYCVFDLETTGFNPKIDKITEIAVCKVKDGEIIDEFSTFVNPQRSIPIEVQELTHITPEMVENAPTIEEILPKFMEFTKNSILVAHNAKFDTGFIKYFADEYKLEFKPYIIDTLTMAQELYPNIENHKLGTIATHLEISLEGAHRAINDTRATAKVFVKMQKEAKERLNIDKYGYMHTIVGDGIKKLPYYHIIILAKDYVGLKNLYKLISFSHVKYFHKRPRIYRSLLNRYKEGLIIGSACERGELYQAILDKKLGNGVTDDEIESIAKYYDYLEIQPLGNNQFYIDKGILNSKDDLIEINKSIVDLADKLNMPVVGTCDVHFLNPSDEIYRRIIMAGQGFSDADKQPPLFLRTTNEMLKEFEYLSPEKAYEVVVTNTNKIADMCNRISPISDEKCPPHIDGCEKEIEDIAMTKAKELYGEDLPEIVKTRLEKELNAIISNGYSVMYIIAQKLVWKSNEDGYLVGSRGSVGSSLAAYMTGITEVNSLKAHYRCPNCKYSDFSDYGYKNGFDMPDKDCPKCGQKLAKDGMDIPFETFLGFNGDKEPDIDLNFSGEYQGKAHRYTEVIFGKGTTFKAGTVGTVAEKTAYGFVLKYLEERGQTLPSPEINRIAAGCLGIKRTSGQHPGGIIVVPKGREIYEFCPVQHPADDPYSDITTTHFDYHSIDKNLLKLDILGHDDPTVIRMLQDITGIDPHNIPLDDKETMSIFSSTESLGVTPNQINGSEIGTFGIPEFGTKFARGMLMDTKPTTFEELIRISGLSHGTDVWLNNAQDLIVNKICTLSEAICTRDDIMIYLLAKGLPPGDSFKIMECVRKGKGLNDEQEALMREHEVPDWYIESCKKIKYMFPKAHAAAYVTMAFRIAWFKVHIPEAFYASYFSIRGDDFDHDFMTHGKDRVRAKLKELDVKLAEKSASNKEENMYPVLEIALEMYERGLEFLPVDIYKSDAKRFIVEDKKIRPPLSKLNGFGEVDAEKLVKAREEGRFTSIEQMMLKSKIGKVAVETLRQAGCLEGMPRSEQMDMFDILG